MYVIAAKYTYTTYGKKQLDLQAHTKQKNENSQS